MERNKSIADIFAKNRAEELPDDVWKMFVYPRNDSKFDLKKWTKSTVVEGGRGSGKTMFIKYHCHPTIFSKNKDIIQLEDFEFIGFHWRPDTFFVQNITEHLLGNRWESSFVSYISISVLIEFSKLINNVINSKYDDEKFKSEISGFQLPNPILETLNIKPKPLVECLEELEDQQYFLSQWINSNNGEDAPFVLDLTSSMNLVISRLSRQFNQFSNTTFNLFIDEFENLTFDQQKVVNTWVKHSRNNSIVSIAYKKYANITRQTKSQEKILIRNDFRVLDIDAGYADDFENLAAEVFLLKWSQYNDLPESKKLLDTVSDPKFVDQRRDESYVSSIKKFVKHVLPGMTLKEISEQVFIDSVLKNKLVNTITQGLKDNNSKLSASSFIDSQYFQASVVNAALVNRKSSNINPELVLIEFEKYKSGENSKYRNWIPNNLKGVLLYLYSTTNNKICPIYSGFDQFTLMSKGNLRHFLELCHQSFSKLEDIHEHEEFVDIVPIDIQLNSTKYTSKLELDKIADLGRDGKYLKRIARRLGRLFAYSQSRRSQSEPEVNHFSIPMSDKSSLKPEVFQLLNECLMWSVLFEEESTKNKTEIVIEEYDYVLHPVLSAHFNISPSKRRKLSLSITDIEALFIGDDDDFQKVLQKFEKKWNLTNDKLQNSEIWEQLSLYD
ncbi:ORC-CDC6 family AAA ATPase [Vibrio diabolicus]|uniref:ORC-CDC6 family AAA ATPase n=1 Tax=Vibrio diabolicus TaxID=50719 RepID=UPI003753846F